MRNVKQFYAYDLVEGPEDIRQLIGTLKIPVGLLRNPTAILDLARLKFRKAKALCVSSKPLPSKIDSSSAQRPFLFKDRNLNGRQLSGNAFYLDDLTENG